MTSNLAACTAFNPLINLYFDRGLRDTVMGMFAARDQSRRIGSMALSSASSDGSGRSGAGPKSSAHYLKLAKSQARRQRNLASRFLSRYSSDGSEVVGLEEEARRNDALTRASLREELFGPDAVETSPEEKDALRRGKELVRRGRKNLEKRKQMNSLVKLESCEREGEVQLLKATATVRADPEDVATFLHDYESYYFSWMAEKDPSLRDRYKLEGNEDDVRSLMSFVR